MQWTNEKTTWLGTQRARHGRWHHIPYAVHTMSTKGMTARGWAVLIAISVLLIAVAVIKELLL